MPQRVQRRRTRGWRMPDGAIYVGRPTRWGNIVRVGWHHDPVHYISQLQAVDMYRAWILNNRTMQREARFHLRDHDLVCWCALDEPCHADVLLQIANVA